ncbi:TPA: hypothetical protein ACGUTZ_004386 [Vibrio vulnificus]
METSFQELIELFSVTAIAAFVGVWGAVKIEARKKEKENLAALLKEYSYVYLHYKVQKTTLDTMFDYISGYKNDDKRHLTMMPTSTPENVVYLQPKDFSFLLLENNELAFNLSMLQGHMKEFFKKYEQRNQLHYQWQNGDKGAALEKNLLDNTDHLFNELDELPLAIDEFMGQLSKFAEEKFKNVRLEEIETGSFIDFINNKKRA